MLARFTREYAPPDFSEEPGQKAVAKAAWPRALGRDFPIEAASVQLANSVFQDEHRMRALRQHDVRTLADSASVALTRIGESYAKN